MHTVWSLNISNLTVTSWRAGDCVYMSYRNVRTLFFQAGYLFKRSAVKNYLPVASHETERFTKTKIHKTETQKLFTRLKGSWDRNSERFPGTGSRDGKSDKVHKTKGLWNRTSENVKKAKCSQDRNRDEVYKTDNLCKISQQYCLTKVLLALCYLDSF